MERQIPYLGDEIEFAKAFLDFDIYIKKVTAYVGMYQAIIYNYDLDDIEVPYLYGHKYELLQLLDLLPEHISYCTIMGT